MNFDIDTLLVRGYNFIVTNSFIADLVKRAAKCKEEIMAKRQGKGEGDLIKEELREEQVKDIKVEYFCKFRHMPPIPMYQSTGEDSKFGNFVKMAIERGTPLTERDYNKYYPNNV